ncbi:sigma factor-like helix-turn-helix DNA-binding protein [Mycobacterium shimoidei]|nr:sigma factor-like helix-turn-helix DNA-binding protein [Mycobacterium shimoidei]MCV7260578.1 hypothetical protein [Mycobacterium shimoidei]ODR13729.1 hypothetical protein BHQ16_08570 [Mycobacterium shimoidei]ORW76287.1 hypothetical protein AWC26_21395 [Mycobacterium shimoidei]
MKPSDAALRLPVPGEGDAMPTRLLVSEALARLSAEHRSVIARSFYQGLTTGQIADELGIPEAVVKSRLHHALHALRLMVQTQLVAEAQKPDIWPLSLGDTAHGS